MRQVDRWSRWCRWESEASDGCGPEKLEFARKTGIFKKPPDFFQFFWTFLVCLLCSSDNSCSHWTTATQQQWLQACLSITKPLYFRQHWRDLRLRCRQRRSNMKDSKGFTRTQPVPVECLRYEPGKVASEIIFGQRKSKYLARKQK